MHVTVLGAGYAGLTVTQELEQGLPEEVDITLVDERDTHLVKHLLHRLIRFPSLLSNLTVPLEELLDRATHRQDRVVDVDPDAGRVELEEGGSLSSDLLAVCIGAETAFYDIPGLEAHATPLRRPAHAERIRERFEEVQETSGRVVVGGAGLSGIQVAGELAEMATEDVEIRLVERLENVAPGFRPAFQRALAEKLEARGVRVETEQTVTGADDDAVTLAGDDRLPYDQLIWTGGIGGREAVGDERPTMNATLRLGDQAFACGDAVRAIDANGEAVPASAQTAVGQAAVVASNIETLAIHELAGGGGFEPRLSYYRNDERGWLVSVGDASVGQVGPTVVRGSAATFLKTTVGAGYLGRIGDASDAAAIVEKAVRSESGD